MVELLSWNFDNFFRFKFYFRESQMDPKSHSEQSSTQKETEIATEDQAELENESVISIEIPMLRDPHVSRLEN